MAVGESTIRQTIIGKMSVIQNIIRLIDMVSFFTSFLETIPYEI